MARRRIGPRGSWPQLASNGLEAFALHEPEGEVVGPALRRRLRAVQARNVRLTHLSPVFRSFGSLFPPLQRGGHAHSACATRFMASTHDRCLVMFPTHEPAHRSHARESVDMPPTDRSSKDSHPWLRGSWPHLASNRLDIFATPEPDSRSRAGSFFLVLERGRDRARERSGAGWWNGGISSGSRVRFPAFEIFLTFWPDSGRGIACKR